MPTYLSIDAMPGVYPAPFENHNAARYLSEAMDILGNDLDPGVRQMLELIIKFSSGAMRCVELSRLLHLSLIFMVS
jgi:hypothetical protein